MNTLTRNGDGLLISLFPWKGDDGKLRIGPAWDYNWSSYYISGGPTGSLLYRSGSLWYPRLFADPDFTQFYIDRWWDLRRGPMSNTAMDGIIDRQAADITLEKALLNGLPSTTEWTSRLTQMKTWLRQRADWIDGNYLRPPSFNQNGGEVPEGYRVVITGVGGTLYVTTDGGDPRAPGGGVAATARAYRGPLPLNAPTVVRARIKNGANWSGLTSAIFSTPQDLTQLLVTEIMYAPPALGSWSGDDLEFLELKNAGTNTLDLGTLSFATGITFAFTNGTRLGPGQFFVLGRNAAGFGSRYQGVAVNGVYAGKLDNGGETLRLATALGSTVFDLTYSDHAPWPVGADGGGTSLQRRSAANGNDPANWVAAIPTPGMDYTDPNLDSDGDGVPDWQEYLAGTDPANPLDYMKIDSASVAGSVGITLGFHAVANKTYTLQYTDALETGAWMKLADISAKSSNRNETINDAKFVTNRFYRLVTPRQP